MKLVLAVLITALLFIQPPDTQPLIIVVRDAQGAPLEGIALTLLVTGPPTSCSRPATPARMASAGCWCHRARTSSVSREAGRARPLCPPSSRTAGHSATQALPAVGSGFTLSLAGRNRLLPLSSGARMGSLSQSGI